MNKSLALSILAVALPLAAAPTAMEFTEKELKSQFYADLGPDEIDVSAYPDEQKLRYALFKKNCSACHTLARAINSPTSSRSGWRAYMAEMRLRSKLASGPIPPEDAKQILEFLVFDGKLRKLDDRAAFEARTRELQKRFWQSVAERMSRLQSQQLKK